MILFVANGHKFFDLEKLQDFVWNEMRSFYSDSAANKSVRYMYNIFETNNPFQTFKSSNDIIGIIPELYFRIFPTVFYCFVGNHSRSFQNKKQ